ncbi:MAG: hypothetical protein M3169_02685 [Candidatus Eremiobacteraeota bacterium]|nr:hypothetical protein [Candidatus Eremiobacteraeota bacterium]
MNVIDAPGQVLDAPGDVLDVVVQCIQTAVRGIGAALQGAEAQGKLFEDRSRLRTRRFHAMSLTLRR